MSTSTEPAVSETRSRWLTAVAIWFIVALSALLAYALTAPPHFSLALDMASSSASTAQLFYSSEGHYSERNSQTAAVPAGSLDKFQHLTFDLPAITIRSLRFDPLMTAGTVVIRNVTIRSGKRVLRRIPATDIVPYNQISKHEQEGEAVRFSTAPQAADPGMLFILHQAVRLRHFDRIARIRQFLVGFALLLGFFALVTVYRRHITIFAGSITSRVKRVNVSVDHFAARISNPDWLVIDGYAIWFYVVCVILFAGSAAADLNGSSAEILSRDYHHGATSEVLVGTPEGVRSDEWSYQTPDMLNQMFRRDRFAAAKTELGAHSVGLMGNVPLLHISTLFRPQLWSFFVLPADYAYAVNWQFKALLLLTGVFTWLLLFTRSTFWAATGSIWFFFSPLTQWDYSWASALPEMIGLICFATVFACYLTVGTRRPILLLAAIGFAACAINFAVCAYLPHMIPLALLAIFFFAAWCFAKRDAIRRPHEGWYRIMAGALALAIVAAVGFIIYRDLHTAIIAALNTVYPGHRIERSGVARPYQMLAHFMQYTETENRYPAMLGNVCEGSGYLWLAPVTLLCVGRLSLSRVQRYALAALWLVFCLFLAWFFLPVPAVLGRVLGLDHAGMARIMPAVGLANIGIVVLCGAALRVPRPRPWFARALTPLLAFGIFFAALQYTDVKLQHYFTERNVAVFALLAALPVAPYLWRKKWAFAITLMVPQVIAFGAINPIERGLPVFTKSGLRQLVRERPALLDGKWLMFSDTPVTSGFLAATGCDVYTGLHYIPDIDHFRIYAANHLDLQILNRDGYLGAHLRKPDEKMSVGLRTVGYVEWRVSPADPILKQLGIRYVAFDFQPPAVWLSYMTPLSTTAVDGFWLYELR